MDSINLKWLQIDRGSDSMFWNYQLTPEIADVCASDDDDGGILNYLDPSYGSSARLSDSLGPRTTIPLVIKFQFHHLHLG